MHEKLINSEGNALTEPEFRGPEGTRTVRLPAGLSEQELARLTPDEIDLLVRQAGPVVGYASLMKLAAGVAGTPANTQFHAAKLLVERAAELDAAAKADRGTVDALRNLSHDQLQRLIASLQNDGGILDQVPET